MKISGKRDYLANLESITMTDIVLNMFIFFFISFSLLYTFNPNRIQELKIKLPEAKSTTPIEDKNQIKILITDEGTTYLDEEIVTLKELRGKVNVIRKKNPELSVLLHSDKSVRFKNIVDVIDILSELKIKNLNIAVAAEQ